MALNEACQVWIEQRISEELDSGKAYRAIGREIAQEIERLFQAKVKPHTIEMRAQRAAKPPATNVAPKSTSENHCEIEENQVSTHQHGGSREGAGRPGKFCHDDNLAIYKSNYDEPMQYAKCAIVQLEMIDINDSNARNAFMYVLDWINLKLRRGEDGTD